MTDAWLEERSEHTTVPTCRPPTSRPTKVSVGRCLETHWRAHAANPRRHGTESVAENHLHRILPFGLWCRSMLGYWKLWIDCLKLGHEAQQVIAMRVARIARGSRGADAECRRMVSEKLV